MAKERLIAVVTGTRADYGIYTSVLKAIQKTPGLDYSLVASCMHLSPEFGNTINFIKRDGFKIGATVEMLLNSDTGAGMAKSFGLGAIGFAQAFESLIPDVAVVLGDRGEMLAAAVAASFMNIPVAHLHGGEVTGSIDESIRHAITKFSHIHFPATRKAVERLKKLGEDEWRIHLVGAPGVDSIYSGKATPREELARKYGLDLSKPIVLAVQHPVTTEVNKARKEMKATVDAIVELGLQTILIRANADAGNMAMLQLVKEMEEHYAAHNFIKRFASIPHGDYLGVMKIAGVMVSNSSSGIIEAPSIGTPVINIGTRQEGRERAVNVIDVGYDKKQILSAARKALSDKKFIQACRKCENPYDPFKDGKAGERIAKVLEEIKIDQRLIQKKIVY